jgi:hypothetical protein
MIGRGGGGDRSWSRRTIGEDAAGSVLVPGGGGGESEGHFCGGIIDGQ